MSGGRRILIVGVNWLGDGCMTMPALQIFREQHPDDHITMLAKPPLTPLWELHPGVDQILTLCPGNRGLLKTVYGLRKQHFDVAYILPNSWRSALVPFLAGIHSRIGTAGHNRRILLTERIQLSDRARNGHQQWEYVDILQLPNINSLPPPALKLPEADRTQSQKQQDSCTIGLIPGAARGTSKQWPESHFIEAARKIREICSCRFVIFGTTAESAVCSRIAAALEPDAENRAGRTSLGELAAGLKDCHIVICNDSGGMHLAAAAGTPVVAIYGLTDPTKTGPLGMGHHCIQAEPEHAARDISRRDPKAEAALRRIAPELVADAVRKNLSNRCKPA